jgi:diguanylate cyclase (GGDEF)-like protein
VPATLAGVAGRLMPLLGGVALPLHVAGVFLVHGAGRWVLLAGTLILVLGMARPTRTPKLREAPGTVGGCVAAMVIWASVASDHPVALAVLLAVTMVYLGLMVPRPYAEIGIAAVAITYAFSGFFSDAGGQPAAEVAGVVATNTTLGILVLGIRITTERRVNERTLALAEANAKLELLSLTDPLTGLANRRRLADALATTWQHAETGGSPVSAIMVDIDYFKQYNDRFGHPGGDGCLRELAEVLSACSRGTDIVARYGGEEFAVVLPDTDLAEACQVAERIRRAVAQLERPHPASPTGYLTVSVGVAEAAPGDTGRPDVLGRADQCLYTAKRNGRNQVAFDGAGVRQAC